MSRFFTPVIILSILYLSSCNSNDNNLSLPVIPSSDSVSTGSFMQISFGAKNFYFEDLTVLNSPIHTLYAGTQASDVSDTLWIAQIQMTDHKSKMISLNLTAYNNSSGVATGTYLINDNSSTLTDFSDGANRVYAIETGSSVTLSSYGYITQGTMNLKLNYNHTTTIATGNFTIKH